MYSIFYIRVKINIFLFIFIINLHKYFSNIAKNHTNKTILIHVNQKYDATKTSDPVSIRIGGPIFITPSLLNHFHLCQHSSTTP